MHTDDGEGVPTSAGADGTAGFGNDAARARRADGPSDESPADHGSTPASPPEDLSDLGDQVPLLPQTEPRPVVRHPLIDIPVAVVTSGYKHRITGLAAEIAFFAVLSLPPLLFGLAGSVGFVTRAFDVTTVEAFRSQLIHLLGRFLTPQMLDQTVVPTLDEVLGAGRFDVLSIGFVLAIWSGSRAVAVLAETTTIMYGLVDERGYIRTRAHSIGTYLIGLAFLAFLLPLILAGPGVLDSLLPLVTMRDISPAYWTVIALVTTVAIAGMFRVMVPLRRRFVADLPGAGLTMVLWLLAGALLRTSLGLSLGSSTLYGPLAAPIALLIGVYVLSLIILVGAGLNAALITRYPSFSGVTRSDARSLATD